MIICKICYKEVSCIASHIKHHNISSKEYYIKYVMKDINEMICEYCGKEAKFISILHGFKRFCGTNCHNSFRKGKSVEEYFKDDQKAKNFRMKRKDYLTKHNPNQNPEVILKKIGDNNPSKRKEVREKIKKSFSNRTDKFWKDRFDKTKKTNLEKYGNECALKNEIIKNKSKLTCIKKYGYEYSSQSPLIKEKKQKTFIEKFGTFFPKNKSYKWKEFILPSGKTIKIQGKEDIVINKLLKFISEDEILIHKGVPAISYIDEFGEKRKHFPDFYIPRLNWIFECKCNYTWNPNEAFHKNNILKLKAAKSSGFKYNIIII